MSPNKYEILFQVMRRVFPGTPGGDILFKLPFEVEHDRIYSSLTIDHVQEDSEDGKLLVEAGWFIDDAYIWSTFT